MLVHNMPQVEAAINNEDWFSIFVAMCQTDPIFVQEALGSVKEERMPKSGNVFSVGESRDLSVRFLSVEHVREELKERDREKERERKGDIEYVFMLIYVIHI